MPPKELTLSNLIFILNWLHKYSDAKEESRRAAPPGFYENSAKRKFFPSPSLTSQRSPGGSVAQYPPCTGGIHTQGISRLSLVNTTPVCVLIGWSQSRMLRQLRKDNTGRTWLITTPTIDCDTDTGGGGGKWWLLLSNWFSRQFCCRDFRKHEKWKKHLMTSAICAVARNQPNYF